MTRMDGVEQRVANRLWRLEWRRFRRRVEVIHAGRMMRPELGYGWLYGNAAR